MDACIDRCILGLQEIHGCMGAWVGQAGMPEGVLLVLHGMDEGSVENWAAGARQGGVAVG